MGALSDRELSSTTGVESWRPSIGEFDLDGAVVEQFGGAVAGDFVHFVEALPGESDLMAAIFDVEAGL
jgi:hypothetical protein